MRLCKDCRYFRDDGEYLQRCHHPVIGELADLMNGSMPDDYKSLHFIFMRLTRCGPGGMLWEKRK